jgi:hypothetical protein
MQAQGWLNWLAVVLYCAIALSFSACNESVTRRTVATELSIKGTVVFGTAEQNNFHPITLQSRIHDGNVVRTSYGALLNFALIPPALGQMSSNSEIKIEKLTISKDGNQTKGGMLDRIARMRLNRGKITVLFRRHNKSGSQLTISAPSAAITVDSDCLFRVQRNGTTTRLTCVRGKLYASPNAQSPVAIDSGYFQEWPSVHPTPIAADDDPAAQIDIVDSLAIADQLRQLQASWQKRRPFE